MTKSLGVSAADKEKIPLTISDFYQDNNYQNNPEGLIDGDVTTGFSPGYNLIYTPNDVVVDLLDYNATVKKIRLYDGNGDGFNTKLILVRKDNDEEVEVGTFTGNEWNKWIEFTPPSFFVASRFILRGGANAGYGNELELLGDYTPYKPKTYNRPKQPLKNMLGVNAHWWDFLNNQTSKATSVDPDKYKAFLDLGLTSLRNYGNAAEYQPIKDKWAFNPVRQGWYEDELMKRLKADRPDLIKWSVMQGQFDFVKETWNKPDSSFQIKGTVKEYVNHGTWGVLVINSTFSKGTGSFNYWQIGLLSPPAGGKTEKDYSQTSSTFFQIPTTHPSKIDLVVGGNLPYMPGQLIVVYKGQRSQLNIYASDNKNRGALTTWETLGRMAFVTASRKGTNKKVPDYGIWSHVDYDPEHAKWIAPNELIKGGGLANLFEGMNEPNAWWAGYDDYLNGKYLAPAWSMMYDGHKGLYANCGVKNADPNFKMSMSGLAVSTTDILRAVYDWSRKNRGYKPDGSVNLPFDIIQFHNYSYTGGSNQYAGGVQAGLPPELSNVLTAVDEFINYSNKYAAGREVWVGEWGIDVHPESPMSAPSYGPYSAEQTRGNWAMRTILEYAAHGLDRAQWYRLYQDYPTKNSDKDATQFATMALLRQNDLPGHITYTRTLVGDYFKQIGEMGDYVFESRVSESPRVLKFRNGKKIMYAVWAVEDMKMPEGKKPVFTEISGNYLLRLPPNTTIKLRRFVDGSGQMSSQEIKTKGSYTVPFGSKPVFVTYDEAAH